MYIGICIGLVDVAVKAKIPGNTLGTLTKILILMDYSLICEGSSFNFENNKSMSQGYFPIQLVTGFTCPETIFQTKEL